MASIDTPPASVPSSSVRPALPPRRIRASGAPSREGEAAPNGVLLRFCMGDLARAILTGLITSYLMVVFVPQSTASLPILLPTAALTFAIVRGVGSVIDAVIDPLIAHLSDRSTSASGRRVPFLRWSVLPWALTTALVVVVPVSESSPWNTMWVAVVLTLNMVAQSCYSVPYFALQAEIVEDPARRVWFFTMNTLLFVIGSAVVFLAPVVKGGIVAAGVDELAAWQLTFVSFSTIGFAFALVPAFGIRERRWVDFKPSRVPLLASFRATLRYRAFVVLLGAYLVMWIAFSLFNAALLYYVTMLLGAPESFGTVVAILTIVVGVASYWPINALARRIGKKPLMVGACVVYVVIYTAIFFSDALLAFIPGTVFAVLIGVVIGFPISVTNILPAAAFADLTQLDTVRTGVNRAGMFYASRNFIQSLSQSAVLFVTPAIIALGSHDGSATVEGVRLTAGIAACVIAVSVVLYAAYDERGVNAEIAPRPSTPRL